MDNPINHKIAVVGLGALFPDANNVDEFWQNIITKKVSIKQLPEELFESDIYYRPDLLTALNKQDKSITNIAAWIENLHFDTVRKYKIPPSVAEHMDPNQHAALYATDQALQNKSLDTVPNDRVAVILGNGMVGTSYGNGLARVQFDLIEHYLKKNKNFNKLSENEQLELIKDVRAFALKDSIPITEDSAPGVLPNIIAARIASVYDFHGPSYTIDAACASVIAAVTTGIKGLQLNEFDAVICGGADMPLKQLGFIYFSALNALSPTGSFPFDIRANGFVMGQGAGTVVLKRLEDAVKQKDTIYAVITGYGEASDGKGKYIAAPNPEWQARTIEKACKMAGYPIDTIELIEAHGTATIVGDVVEVEGLKKAFDWLGSSRKNYCGLTSAKSNIGHLKSAAGIAGLIKAVLAIHTKQLPPTASFEEINPKLQLEDSPFYIINELQQWKGKKEYPRRANVSAFGFGGADYHLTLEEYREDDYPADVFTGYSTSSSEANQENIKIDSAEIKTTNVVFFSGDSVEEIHSHLNKFKETVSEKDLTFDEFCTLQNYSVFSTKQKRLAILAESVEELDSKYQFFIQNKDKMADKILNSKGIFFKEGKPVTADKTALLFPGQASQYLNMFRSVYDQFDTVRSVFDQADAFWFSRHGHTISSLIFPKKLNEETATEQLRQTQNAHPTIFTSSLALYELLKTGGMSAKYMIGHSLGEITALAAAGKLALAEAFKLVEQRGYAFYDEKLKDPGKMISLKCTLEKATELVDSCGIDVSIANINSLQQIIVAGSSPNIDMFKKYLDKKKIVNKLLFVSHAFHTPLLKPVAERYYKNIKDLKFLKSSVKVIMNNTNNYYPNTAKELTTIPTVLKDQILQPVNFVRSIKKLYEDGVRLFVEVGPNSILSSLVKDILSEKDITVLTSNYKNTDDILSLQKLQGALFSEGMPIKPLSIRSHVKQPFVGIAQVEQALKDKQTDLSDKFDKKKIVYSGVSIGLSGSYKEMFRDDNFEQVFQGRNFIERLTDEEKQKFVDLQISKLIKDEKGPSFKLLSSLEDVIQLAGKIGKLDLFRDYHIDEKEVENMTTCIASGVAAGYEALKDAHIPLVQEYIKTSTGKILPKKLALPKEMQEETGVIFANGFPMIDPVIEEVSRFISFKYGNKTRKELMTFYESIIERIKDSEAKKLLTDWYTLFYNRLTDNPGQEDIFQFNFHFMNQISAQANNRLAYLINAKGPNFQLNAACSSTSNAITIAEDFIRSGRVKRMIVIGADDPTSKTNFPVLGAGFLCTGAATNEGDLYKAAIPFDSRRNGMIISAGAVGIVLETKEDVEQRGLVEVCELLGTHSFNTAKHPSQIDSQYFSSELDKFISCMELNHGLNRDDLAEKIIYISHETYTPPRGGCSQTEVAALQFTFGEKFTQIIVGNTKGMTGHTMGASIEDAVSAKALQYGKVPPIVNLSEPDPMFEGLNISRGGKHDRIYALKMSAGFGSQGHFILLKKSAENENRIINQEKNKKWLQNISSDNSVSTEHLGRLFVLKNNGNGASVVNLDETIEKTENQKSQLKKVATESDASQKFVEEKRPSKENIIETISSLTQYPPEMLEPDMEFGADLGISKEKQELIATKLSEKFLLSKSSLQITDETTIGFVIDNILKDSEVTDESKLVASTSVSIQAPDNKDVIKVDTLQVFSEVTKYPIDMLELDMEMEADLGIDTVKQATILSILGEKYRLEQDEGMQLSNYPTIGHIVDLINEKQGTAVLPPPLSDQEENLTVQSNFSEIKSISSDVPQSDEDSNGKDDIKQETLKVFSEVTKYPIDMLELDMEMEADLGIDTVKQATILSILGEKYQLERDEGMQLSNYPTIGHIVDLLYEKGMSNFTSIVESAEKLEMSEEKEQIDIPASPQKTQSVLSRQIPVLVEEQFGTKSYDLKNKNLWLIGDNKSTVNQIGKLLEKTGANIQTFVFSNSVSAETIEKEVVFFIKNNVDVIIDTSHIGDEIQFSKLSSKQSQQVLFKNSEARFIFYKHLEKRKIRPTKIVCLTTIDGLMGIDKVQSKVSDPTFGALLGFYKALRKEWHDSDVKIIDFSPEDFQKNINLCVDQVISEIEHSGVGVEIAYSKTQRMVVKIEDCEIQAKKNLTFSKDDTFLISGGGTGIASKIFLTLAERYQSNFILIDIIPIPKNIDELIQLDEKALETLREKIHSILKESHKKVTPVMLNQEFEKITKAIEIYRNIKLVEKFGCKVAYISCDIRDYDELKLQLENAKEKTGFITAVIHAAGIDKSHLLDRKSIKEFHDVFTVKASGAFNLMALCKNEPLRLVVAFSSIAGRFGNAAQLDYSAANSFLSYWIKMIGSTNPNVHVLSLLWSGWKDVGIAWRNEFVRQKSEEMGLNFIDLDLGIKTFLQEIANQTDDKELILHKGLNGFIENNLSKIDHASFPLIDRLTKKDSKIDRAYRVFSIKRDAFLDQHRLGKIPILPAVAYSELAAEYYVLQEGRKDSYLLRNIKFENAFKLFREEARELFIEGSKVENKNNWEIKIKSAFKPPKAIEPQMVLHSSSSVTDQLPDYSAMNPNNWNYFEAEPSSLPADESLMLIKSSGPEQRIILGPLYNDVLRESEFKEPVLIYPNGTTYPTYFPKEQLTNDKYPLQHFLTNPCFLDSIYQACAAHLLVTKKRVYLPWEVGELGIVNVPKEDGLYKSYAQVIEDTDDIVIFNVVMIDGNGNIRYFARNTQFRKINL